MKKTLTKLILGACTLALAGCLSLTQEVRNTVLKYNKFAPSIYDSCLQKNEFVLDDALFDEICKKFVKLYPYMENCEIVHGLNFRDNIESPESENIILIRNSLNYEKFIEMLSHERFHKNFYTLDENTKQKLIKCTEKMRYRKIKEDWEVDPDDALAYLSTNGKKGLQLIKSNCPEIYDLFVELREKSKVDCGVGN